MSFGGMFSEDSKVSSKRVLAFLAYFAAGALYWFDKENGGTAMLCFAGACLGITGYEKVKANGGK